MAAYIITYDLHKVGQNYDGLIDQIKESYPTNWHVQLSVWIVQTASTSAQIRDNLKPYLDSNDKLFVAKLTGEAAWFRYSQNVTDWLKKNL